jgi:hypothetical protein
MGPEKVTCFGIIAGKSLVLSGALKDEDDTQREVFHAITGPWMGTDSRRGLPYTWLPNHLGDAHSQTSPRSFLAALKAAAAEPLRHGQKYALHYESIKKGVQQASRIRVSELVEDYAWIETVMKALEGLVVPCEFKEIRKRWEKKDMLSGVKRGTVRSGDSLPPARLADGYDGIRKDLIDIGVFQDISDGRVNIPDVYRVGFRLRRRGGVRPVR